MCDMVQSPTLLTIIGARPQFVKSKILSLAYKRAGIKEIIYHTMQHYDDAMSGAILRELAIYPINKPNHQRESSAQPNRLMRFMKMTQEIKAAIAMYQPDFVVVFGDTDSTLSGAYAAHLCGVRLVHIEAGLRSFNTAMPEEYNRILTDRFSSLLCAPTEIAYKQLLAESSAQEGVFMPCARFLFSGDVMLDASLYFASLAKKPTLQILATNGFFPIQGDFDTSKDFIIATLHRNTNTDDRARLQEIMGALGEISMRMPILFPLHPRTKNALLQLAPQQTQTLLKNIVFCAPLSYLEMSFCLQRARVVLSDSGGIQKETCFLGKPHITLRQESEYVELDSYLAISREEILAAFMNALTLQEQNLKKIHTLFGNGLACERIVQAIISLHKECA